MHYLVVLALVCSAVIVSGDVCEPDLCHPNETCCPSGTLGDYSCCPFENAVCCADHAFCCPQGAECDIVSGTCRLQEDDLQTFDELVKRLGDLDEETTNDGCKLGACDSDQTCCPTASPGDYSCCPYPNAVCCEDPTFCCPEDTECDVEGRTCISKETTSSSELEKRQGRLGEEESFKQQCGDGSFCPFESTCCTIAGGKYGCCPHSYATCCSDGVHCCPHDEACDVTSHYCVGKRTVHESAVKEPALPIYFEDSA